MKKAHKSKRTHRSQARGQKSEFASLIICFIFSVICFLFSVFHSPTARSEEPQNEAVDIVINALKGEDESMQSMAIALVRDMPGPEVTKVLAKELPNLSVRGQMQLLSALADRGDPIALPAVIEAAKSEDESVRVAALKAIGDLGDASCVSLLAETAAAASAAEQKAARGSLYRLRGPKIDRTILDALPSAEPEVKVELIYSTGERNIKEAVGALLKTATDKDASVRRESIKVLKTVAGPNDLPALVELLLGVKSAADRREAEKTATAVAHKIGDENRQAEAVLTALPCVEDATTRCSLLRVLGKIGDNSALDVLREGLKDKNDIIKETCIRALADWPSAEPIPDILKEAQSSENKLHHVLALRGFVRLLGLDSNRPTQDTIRMYKQAMSLASDISEKKMVLAGLANIKSLDALEMASGYLQDGDLQQEAEVAVIKIAASVGESELARSRAVLQKVVDVSKNELLRTQAKELLNRIKEQ